jgi:hypothetical protein
MHGRAMKVGTGREDNTFLVILSKVQHFSAHVTQYMICHVTVPLIAWIHPERGTNKGDSRGCKPRSEQTLDHDFAINTAPPHTCLSPPISSYID